MSREPVAFLDSRPGPKIVCSATRYLVCGGIFVGPDVIHAPQRRSENDPRGRRMLQASAIPSENFCPLRLIRDSEVLHSRARAERREIRWCEDADGRHLPIPHLPGTDLPPLRPLCRAPGWHRCLPDRRCSLHLDGVLGEQGGGQAVVLRQRPALEHVLTHHITPEQSLVASPRAAVACCALRPSRAATLGRNPARPQPPRLGLIAPPRLTPRRLTKLRRGEREADRTRERGSFG
jgi:hypothetical protein